ncbi:MAG: glycosyltransferase family 2 protein [Nostoc sp. ChiQUE02]|uniref:glycosyltransferase family 2 protein n=1 Tax=Nostoc sp. ChiQUE02 TaxID=3075377 RepID=UPI002AD3B86D|nr:glycosyltransferase family 2 protein [Nostoc sp. ChiQUE02]MDZ8234083.1 glycosyltransferase family 2 protein [Nostoc sp. ChiQUE02]
MITIEATANVTTECEVTITVPANIPPGTHKMVLTIDEKSIADQTLLSPDKAWDRFRHPIQSNLDSVELSIVIPLHNEEPNIDHLFERLSSVLNRLNITYEIICIDDGSSDNTLKCLLNHHYRNPAIKVVSFSRNFGKEIALTAGIDYSQGKAVIPIDADLQDPPELIEQLIDKWREGYDVVYAQRRLRLDDSWLKRSTAKAFYWTISKLSLIDIPANVGDFRLLDRRAIEALKQMPERTRFMKGLFAWVGFKQCSIPYDRQPRYQGQSKWNYWKLWNFALDGITSFSVIPLKIWTYLGLTISFLAFLYAAYLIIFTMIAGITVPGYISLMVVVLFLGGIQLIGLGIIGEYLGRIYEESKQRPLYLVQEYHGFNNSLNREYKKKDSLNSAVRI